MSKEREQKRQRRVKARSKKGFGHTNKKGPVQKLKGYRRGR